MLRVTPRFCQTGYAEKGHLNTQDYFQLVHIQRDHCALAARYVGVLNQKLYLFT
jgi:hypothetical protein